MRDYGRSIQKSSSEYQAHRQAVRFRRVAKSVESGFDKLVRYFLVAFLLTTGAYAVRYFV